MIRSLKHHWHAFFSDQNEERLPLLHPKSSIGAKGPTPQAVAYDDHQPESMMNSYVTLSKTMLGSGILSLPYVVAHSGIIPFLIGIALFAALNSYTMMLLVWSIEVVTVAFPNIGRRGWSFTGLGSCAYGNAGRLTVLVVNGIDLWGTLVAYVIVVSDVLLPLLQQWQKENQHVCGAKSAPMWCGLLNLVSTRPAIIITTALLNLPLCSLKDISSLEYTSVFGLAAMGLFVIYVSLQAFFYSNISKKWKNASFGPQSVVDVFAGLPIIAFAFSAHYNVFSIYTSLHARSPMRMGIVTSGSVWTSTVIYLVLAVLGYLLFNNVNIEGDVIDNFPTNQMGYNIVRALFGIAMFTTIPMICYGVRNMIVRLFVPSEEASMHQLMWVAAGLLGTASLAAIAIPQLSSVFGLIGATTASIMSFVFPPAFYLRVYNAAVTKDKLPAGRAYPSRFTARMVLICGLIFVPLFTILTARGM